MMTASALARLSEPKLRAWLLARMREQHVDPPIDPSRLESPDDLPRLIHAETGDPKLRARLEKATLAALGEVLKNGELRDGPDAWAAHHLAALADGILLHAAAPTLKKIAEHGVFGGVEGNLHPAAEEMVLLALASLQPEEKLWSQWEALWRLDLPRVWPVVTVGLRFSAPERALGILPEAVSRAATHPEFPLGDVVWAYATDPRVTDTDVAKALAGLSPDAKARCRAALGALGAEDAQVDVWLSGADREFPAWARVSSLRQPPRFPGAACR